MSNTQLAQPKLPFWRSIAAAYRLTWENLIKLSRPMLVWLIITAVGIAAIEWTLWLPSGKENEVASYSLLRFWASTVFSLFTGSVIAVSWHQQLLQNQYSMTAAAPINDRVWRYFFWGIVGLLPGILVYLVFQHFFLSDVTPDSSGATDASTTNDDDTISDGNSAWICIACFLGLTVFLIPVLAILSFVQLRFSMMLPAVALKVGSIGPMQAWEASSGNFWRLFWGTGATFGPILAIGMALLLKFEDSSNSMSYAIANSAYYSLLMLGGMVSVAFLSVAFRHFFPDVVENAQITTNL